MPVFFRRRWQYQVRCQPIRPLPFGVVYVTMGVAAGNYVPEDDGFFYVTEDDADFYVFDESSGAIEVNNDVAEFALTIGEPAPFVSLAGINVSIKEVDGSLSDVSIATED